MEPSQLGSTLDAQHNPFEVLELGYSATPRDVSRQRDKLLGMLELGLERAKRYTSPLGERERTADLVRNAARDLERPRSRLQWELWLPPTSVGDAETSLLRTALILHHELLREIDHAIPIGADEFDALGAAWDDVFYSDELYERIAERAAAVAIEVDDADDIATEFGDRVRAEMLSMLESAPAMDVDELESETASDAAHRFVDRKIELLELVGSRFAAPGTFAQRRQQWDGLKREYNATVAGRGAYTHRKAFEAIAIAVGNRASELFNKDIDHQLAETVFSWLCDEARSVGDTDRSEFHGKNLGIVRKRLTDDRQAAARVTVPSRSSGGFAGRGVISLLAVVAMAISRAHSCTDTPSYTYRPPSYQLDPSIQRELREREQWVPDRYEHDVPAFRTH